MAEIVWHSRGKRYVEMGVSKGVLYPMGRDGVAWNGLTTVTESSSGAEIVDLYADNQKYCSFRSAENYEATIEAYTYPEEFAECDGSVAIAEGTRIVQQTRLPFDFCFRSEIIDGDDKVKLNGYKLHLIYNATASPTEKSYETLNDSPDATTFSWEIHANPFVLQGYRASSTIVIDSTKADRMSLEALEKILYGLDEDPPRMPDPIEVLSILQRVDVKRYLMEYLIPNGLWVWDTFNFEEDTVPIAIDREAERRTVFEPTGGEEYSPPSIAYALLSEEGGRRKYMVIIIDDYYESTVASNFEATSGAIKMDVTESGGMYYFRYNLYK